jgi:pimeloyl-ACP methyl ester carboxylesterase
MTGAALALIGAQQHPDRIRKLVITNAVPLLAGYRWHRIARNWRTPARGALQSPLEPADARSRPA